MIARQPDLMLGFKFLSFKGAFNTVIVSLSKMCCILDFPGQTASAQEVAERQPDPTECLRSDQNTGLKFRQSLTFPLDPV